MTTDHIPKNTSDDTSPKPTTEITVTEKQLAVFDVKEAVLSEFKEAESFKCKDAISRKMLGKFRADAKSLRSKIEQARLDKNRETLALHNGAATSIKDRLTKSIDAYDAEIKPYDQVAKDKAEAKAKEKADRLAVITEKMDNLKSICAKPLEYNQISDNIKLAISLIEEIEIDDSFQEMKPQAEMIKIGGIAAAKQALKARHDWETQQAENKRIQDERDAENERIRLENEAKAKELEEAQAKIEAEKEATKKIERWFQTQRDAITDAQDYDLIEVYESTHAAFKEMDIPEYIGLRTGEAGRLISAAMDKMWLRKCALEKAVEEEKEFERELAEKEAVAKAKREAEEAKLAADRKKIEDEKAEIQAEKDRMKSEAEKVRMDERIKWCESVGDVWMLADIEDAEAFQSAFNAGLERAKEIDESIRIEQLAAKEKRAALVEADRKALVEIGLKINELVSSVKIPAFQTQEASRMTGDFFNGLHRVLNELELSLTELI